MQTQDLLDKKQAARRLRCCQRTLDYRLRLGEIPFVKLGRHVRFIREDLEKYILAHRIGAAK